MLSCLPRRSVADSQFTLCMTSADTLPHDTEPCGCAWTAYWYSANAASDRVNHRKGAGYLQACLDRRSDSTASFGNEQRRAQSFAPAPIPGSLPWLAAPYRESTGSTGGLSTGAQRRRVMHAIRSNSSGEGLAVDSAIARMPSR